MLPIYQFMKDSIPADHCRQSRAIEIALTMAEASRPKLIVDLGCGRGKTVDAFRRYSPESRWVGIDIEESPEVSQRSRDDAEFMTFDGINIPFGDGEVDFIYSNQVLEHVRHPELLLRDIRRVLAPGGVFVGQTSHLEPYHSYSLWNFTIYGFKQICEDAGLTVSELRPGIDGVTLVQRTQAGRPPEFSRWFSEESPINREIEAKAAKDNRDARIINFRKLMICGQFCFVCVPAD